MDWKKLLGSLRASVDEELRLRNAYLAAENRLLRQQLPGRVPLSDGDRHALAEIGQQLGRKALEEIATVATLDTILGWHRRCASPAGDISQRHKSVGRPRIAQEIEDVVIRIARENRSWGYDRIAGTLANLGDTISDQTVGNILKRYGMPPVPERKKTTSWSEFIRIHMDVLGATAFSTSTVWSRLMLVIPVLLVFVHIGRHTKHFMDMTASLTTWFSPWDAAVERWMHAVLTHVMLRLLGCGNAVRPVCPENPHQLRYLTFVPAMITLPQCSFLNCAPLVMKAQSMPPVVSILLASIATWFRSRLSMQLEIIALRPQVVLYKQTVSRPRLRTSNRVLWMWLSRLWPGWQRAVAFVQPRTVIAWQQKRCREHWRRLRLSGAPGQPALSNEVRELIQALWRSNPTWGSPRIVGELRKVGIAVAKSTVVKYRPQVRKPPSPTWKAFLANHVQDLVALDFFTVSPVTCKVLFVLVILAHERRQVGHVNGTEQIFFLQGHDDLLLVTLKPASEHGKEKLKES